jgi:hypothetical protein
MEWVNLKERMSISKSHLGISIRDDFGAGSLDAHIERKRFRSCGGGDGGGVWGKWVVVGQDGEDASARGAEKFDASEDADAWGRGGDGGDAGRDSG